jgi:RIO kinase 1
MGSSLEHLLAEGVITEVLAKLQSGKEAEVYVVRFGGKVVAAKVYKDRAHRSFKNNSVYKEGRSMRNSRSQRAVDRGSRFGKAAAEDAWKSAEADALYKLHANGVRVPTPVLFLDGVLLMELVLDADGNAARRIIDTQLTIPQANAAYHDMVGQLVRILSCDLIHGDLSPYNVLWAADGPTVIDFPQVVSASHNSSSERFFLRDAENILGHFGRIDRTLDARRGDPDEIWQAYRRRELSPDFRPTGRSRAAPRRAAPFSPGPARGEAHVAHPRPEAHVARPSQPHRSGPQHGRPFAGGGRPRSHGPEVIVRPNRGPAPAEAHAASPPRPPMTTETRAVADGAGADRPAHRRRRRRR